MHGDVRYLCVRSEEFVSVNKVRALSALRLPEHSLCYCARPFASQNRSVINDMEGTLALNILAPA